MWEKLLSDITSLNIREYTLGRSPRSVINVWNLSVTISPNHPSENSHRRETINAMNVINLSVWNHPSLYTSEPIEEGTPLNVQNVRKLCEITSLIIREPTQGRSDVENPSVGSQPSQCISTHTPGRSPMNVMNMGNPSRSQLSPNMR